MSSYAKQQSLSRDVVNKLPEEHRSHIGNLLGRVSSVTSSAVEGLKVAVNLLLFSNEIEDTNFYTTNQSVDDSSQPRHVVGSPAAASPAAAGSGQSLESDGGGVYHPRGSPALLQPRLLPRSRMPRELFRARPLPRRRPRCRSPLFR